MKGINLLTVTRGREREIEIYRSFWPLFEPILGYFLCVRERNTYTYVKIHQITFRQIKNTQTPTLIFTYQQSNTPTHTVMFTFRQQYTITWAHTASPPPQKKNNKFKHPTNNHTNKPSNKSISPYKQRHRPQTTDKHHMTHVQRFLSEHSKYKRHEK